MHLIPLQSPSNEAVKVRVDKPVGTQSYEVITEDNARYRWSRFFFRGKRMLCMVG